MSGKRYDVLILGGGPAGCATALALRRHAPELVVTIVEASTRERARVAETLAPSALPLLERLGLGERFRTLGALRSAGLVSTWGLREGVTVDDALSRMGGAGFHLDRGAFDRMMLEAAAEAGIEVRKGVRLRGCERVEGLWRFEDGLAACFVIDATGRPAVFARRLGGKRFELDGQIGLSALFVGAGQDRRLLIEPVEEGWFYSALLPDGRRAVALFTDRDLARDLRLHDPREWCQRVEQTRGLKDWIAGKIPPTRLQTHAASTCHLETPIGEGWLAVGDAAFAFDPLAGQGLVKALANGFWAAYAAADLLAGRAEAAAKYRQVVLAEVEPFLAQQRGVYGQEPRWAEAPFWRRRRGRAGDRAR